MSTVRHLVMATVVAFLLDASAHAAAPFFEGKSVRIVVGFSAGGGFDTYSRLIARHLGEHIPGKPTVLVENMVGAASLIAANHLYKVAKPDGLTIGNFHGNQLLNQVLGRQGIEFDARKFEHLGVPVQDSLACALSKASGITTFDKLRTAKIAVKFGGVAPGDATYNTAAILKEALTLPIQLVSGYKGTAEIRLAAESGEVAGGCWQWESIKSTWRRALDGGEVTVVLQANPKPHPELVNVPNAIDFAKTGEARQLIKGGLHDPAAITRIYVLPPGTPKERAQTLRRAFADTMKDPAFLADAKKSNLDIDPLTGEELERLVSGLFKLDAGVVKRLREILK
ncbi:MAG: hypothetical protein HY695_02280 [Deltaproteobacteria bacterium]|nr:hypothetical protein [Deltaproteobacteria bacterium]